MGKLPEARREDLSGEQHRRPRSTEPPRGVLEVPAKGGVLNTGSATVGYTSFHCWRLQ